MSTWTVYRGKEPVGTHDADEARIDNNVVLTFWDIKSTRTEPEAPDELVAAYQRGHWTTIKRARGSSD